MEQLGLNTLGARSRPHGGKKKKKKILIIHVFAYVFVTLNILQSQFSKRGFKKTENSEHSVVLLLFYFTLNKKKQKKQLTKSVSKTGSYIMP